jgi:ADP-ribose pyrophosphatase
LGLEEKGIIVKFPGVREDASFKILDRRHVFQGRVLGVTVDHIRLPGGHETRHEVLHLRSAVCIVPLLEEAPGKVEVVLVEQFRNSVEGYIHEIPAGIIEEGEEPAACAARELEEETGYSASRIVPLTTLLPTPGVSDHKMYYFLAEGLRPGKQRLEAAECLTVKRYPLEDLLASILGPVEGSSVGDPSKATPPKVTLIDSKTHVGILHVALRRGLRAP